MVASANAMGRLAGTIKACRPYITEEFLAIATERALLLEARHKHAEGALLGYASSPRRRLRGPFVGEVVVDALCARPLFRRVREEVISRCLRFASLLLLK